MKLTGPASIVVIVVLATAAPFLLFDGFASAVSDPLPGPAGANLKSNGAMALVAGVGATWLAVALLMWNLSRRSRLRLGMILTAFLVGMLAFSGMSALLGQFDPFSRILCLFSGLALIAWMLISLGELIWRGMRRPIRGRSGGIGSAGA